MKKENRHLAQQRRAEERKRQEEKNRQKKFFAVAIPVILILVLLVILIVDMINSKSSDSSENSAGTSYELQTDTSLSVADGDMVHIDYVGTVDGVVFEGGSTDENGAYLVIGSNTYIDDFEEQLIGSHPGDEVEVNVTFPEDYGNTELAGKDAVFMVTVRGIYG